MGNYRVEATVESASEGYVYIENVVLGRSYRIRASSEQYPLSIPGPAGQQDPRFFETSGEASGHLIDTFVNWGVDFAQAKREADDALRHLDTPSAIDKLY